MVCLGMMPKRNAISVRLCFKNTLVNRPWTNSPVGNKLGACSCLYYVIALSISHMPILNV